MLYVLCIQSKRGLPHDHLLVWFQAEVWANDIDIDICVRLPNKQEDPILNKIIRKNMIHGPCGFFNNSTPCIKPYS